MDIRGWGEYNQRHQGIFEEGQFRGCGYRDEGETLIYEANDFGLYCSGFGAMEEFEVEIITIRFLF